MKIVFVECSDIRTVRFQCPWSAKIVKVCGGYLAFESYDDYSTWKNQR